MKRKGTKLVCLALSGFLGLSVLLQPLPAEALQKGNEQAGVQQDGLEQILNGTVSDSDVEVNGGSTNFLTSENTQMIHVDEDVSSMVYQAGGFGTPAGEDYGIAAYAITSQDQLKDRILEALLKGEASIDVSGDGLTMDDRNEIQVLYAEVLNENPELFYVQTSAGYSYNPTTNAVIRITFKYNDVTEEQKKAFNDKLAEAAALVTSEMSTAEKALVLHDYLAQHCAYAYQEYLDKTLANCPNVYDAYGALVNGKAVCQGYALAYQAMLQKVGIRSYICSSDAMNHAWNVVEIDGRWYHVDVTWDDPVWNREGRARHLYFLLSDTEMGNREHSGWTDSVECTSTEYDSYWWKDVDSQIVQAGHEDYIYVKNVNGKFQLTRRTNGAENAINASDSYYTTAYSYLSRLGDYIYFNDNLKLYSLNLNDLADAPTVEYTYGQNDGYIYGAMVRENGKARLNIYTSPNAETDSYIEVELREVVRVSDVTLSQSTASVKEGETLQLTAAVAPENAENRKVTWSSNDPEVASVGADGTVTAKKAGTVTITVTTVDGGKTASCTVTVTCSHVLTETAAVNATCGTAGNSAYWTCGKCQKIFSDQEGKTEITINDTVTPATGQHKNTEIRNATAATEESEGYTGDTYCKDCNQKVAEGESISRLPHTHAMTKTDAVAAACETDGNVEYWTCSKCGRKYADAAGKEELADVVIRAKGHVPGTWNSDETNHWKKCTVCDKEMDKAAHTFQWVVDKAATEDATGLCHEECICGAKRNENTEIPKIAVPVTGVSLDQSSVSLKDDGTLKLTATITPANADEQKVTWSSSDSEVASVGADGTVTAKKAGTVTITVTTIDGGKTASCTVTVTCSHVLTETAAVNATCGTTGNIAYWTCGKCQKIFSDQEGKTEITINDTVTPATGQHKNTEIRNATAATEESEGYTGDTYCKDCNQKVADGKPIPRLPHTHAMIKTDAVAAACETDGNVEYWTCSKCGRKYADAAGTEELADVVIRAKGHVPGAWNSDETNHWKKCTVCGKEMDKAAHTFQWVVDKAATEDETGLSHEECVCGVRRSENTVIPKLDHVHIGIQHHDAVAATCTTKGSVEYWTCSSPKCAGKCYGDSACQIVLASTETPVNPNNHAGAGYWSIDDVKHVYICSCGVVLTDGAHVYDNDMDHDCNQCGYKRFYVVINGANVVYETDSESDLVITANGEYQFFQSVEVDGKVVDKANYEVKEGSTIVTLKKAYLDTLSMGTHDFRVLYTDGKVASTQFTLQEKAGTDDDSDDNSNAASTDTQKAVAPKTGDMNQPVPLAVILVVCAFMIAGILVSKRRNCYR